MEFPYEFKYTLTSDEIYEASKDAGLFKTSGTRRIVYTVLLVLSCLMNLYIYFFKEKSGNYLMVAALSLAVLFAVWYYPEREMKNKAERQATKKPVPAKVYEDRIEISEDEQKWDVVFDNTFSFKESEKFLLIFSRAGRVVAFPKRDIDAEILPELTKFFESKSTK